MNLSTLGLVSTRLQYFQAVVQFGSIRRASESLRVAPSAISRSIRQLESELGAPLFERVRQRLKLTSAGETLAYHARASQRELARACALIEDLQGLRRGRISVAAVESATRSLLPRVLASFWQQHPNVTVDVQTAGSQEAVDALADGRCDLAVAFDVRLPRRCKRLASAQLNLGALVPPTHALAGAGTAGVRLRDFASERVLLADHTLTLGRLVDDAAHAAGVEFQVRAVSKSIHNLAMLARSGRGVTFQTRVGVEEEIEKGQLVFLPLLDRSLRPRQLSMMASSQGQLSDAPASLASMLGQAIDELDESATRQGHDSSQRSVRAPALAQNRP